LTHRLPVYAKVLVLAVSKVAHYIAQTFKLSSLRTWKPSVSVCSWVLTDEAEQTVGQRECYALCTLRGAIAASLKC